MNHEETRDSLHGVQGVECSNHSVPTKKLQKAASATWLAAFLFAVEKCGFAMGLDGVLSAPTGTT